MKCCFCSIKVIPKELGPCKQDKFEETGQLEDKRSSGRPKNLLIADERYLRGMFLRNRKKHSSKELRDVSGRSADPSTVLWGLIRNCLLGRLAVKKPFLRKGNREKMLRCTKWHKNWTASVATGLMEGWILPRARTSTLLKQCGIILTENGTKGNQHPKKSFGMSFKKPGELFLKTT